MRSGCNFLAMPTSIASPESNRCASLLIDRARRQLSETLMQAWSTRDISCHQPPPGGCSSSKRSSNP